MTHHYHPVFDGIPTDPFELDAGERTVRAKLRQIEGSSHAKREIQTARLMQALDAISIATPAPMLAQHAPPRPTPSDECTSPLRPGERQDAEGRIWDEATHPKPGTLVTPTPRQAEKKTTSRYDRAFTAAREAKEVFNINLTSHGPADPRTIEAMEILLQCEKRFEKEKERAKHDIARHQDAVDLHRQTPEGRAQYNEGRRKSRTVPNADLSGKSDLEKAEHRKRKNRERQQRKRENERIAKSAIA